MAKMEYAPGRGIWFHVRFVCVMVGIVGSIPAALYKLAMCKKCTLHFVDSLGIIIKALTGWPSTPLIAGGCMENKTMSPECIINNQIIEYDLCTTERNKMYENESQVYIGYGYIHSIKGRLELRTNEDIKMHFYKRIN